MLLISDNSHDKLVAVILPVHACLYTVQRFSVCRIDIELLGLCKCTIDNSHRSVCGIILITLLPVASVASESSSSQEVLGLCCVN